MYYEKRFILSIKAIKNCYFSRRNGYKGTIIGKYSIILRLFNYNIL